MYLATMLLCHGHVLATGWEEDEESFWGEEPLVAWGEASRGNSSHPETGPKSYKYLFLSKRAC